MKTASKNLLQRVLEFAIPLILEIIATHKQKQNGEN